MNRPAAHVYVEYSPHFQDGVGNEAETKIFASSLFTSGLACPNHQDTNDWYANGFPRHRLSRGGPRSGESCARVTLTGRCNR
jgi:hypothetical protein